MKGLLGHVISLVFTLSGIGKSLEGSEQREVIGFLLYQLLCDSCVDCEL